MSLLSTAHHGEPWNEALRLKNEIWMVVSTPKNIIYWDYMIQLYHGSITDSKMELYHVFFQSIPAYSGSILIYSILLSFNSSWYSHIPWCMESERSEKNTSIFWTAVCSRSSMVEWSVWNGSLVSLVVAAACSFVGTQHPVASRLLGNCQCYKGLFMSLPTELQNCHRLIYIYIYIHMGVSENSVPLKPMVNDNYPYEKWLFHWEYTLFSDKPIYHYP